MMRLDLEVCPGCLGPVTGSDPECAVCADEYVPILLRVEARGGWTPPTRPTWGWDGGDPGDPGGWDGDIESVRRSDTGKLVSWDDLPTPTKEILERDMAELAAEEALYAREDRECADEDRWDAMREEER